MNKVINEIEKERKAIVDNAKAELKTYKKKIEEKKAEIEKTKQELNGNVAPLKKLELEQALEYKEKELYYLNLHAKSLEERKGVKREDMDKWIKTLRNEIIKESESQEKDIRNLLKQANILIEKANSNIFSLFSETDAFLEENKNVLDIHYGEIRHELYKLFLERTFKTILETDFKENYFERIAK